MLLMAYSHRYGRDDKYFHLRAFPLLDEGRRAESPYGRSSNEEEERMARRVSRPRSCQQRTLPAVDRAVMLMALGLDPRFTYTDHELQSAWRRRRLRSGASPASNGGVATAAINAAYVALINQAQIPRPVEVRL
jgi:hypothetical protein